MENISAIALSGLPSSSSPFLILFGESLGEEEVDDDGEENDAALGLLGEQDLVTHFAKQASIVSSSSMMRACTGSLAFVALDVEAREDRSLGLKDPFVLAALGGCLLVTGDVEFEFEIDEIDFEVSSFCSTCML